MNKILTAIQISILSFLFSGCASIVTAPIEIAGATVSAVIDVTGSAIRAVTKDDDKDKKEK